MGEVIVYSTSIPVPGPVLGMIFMFFWLCQRGHISKGTDKVTGSLLSNMSLLFIPAGVGIIRHADQIQNEALAIFISIVAGTIVTIVIVAWLGQYLLQKQTLKTNKMDTEQ